LAESARCIRVVSAVVERQGRYLITQRLGPGILAGLWEFPTGQVAPGESDEAALRREIRERIGVEILVGRLRARRTHFYVGYSLERVVYDVQILPDQQPCPLRVADIRWVAAEDLERYPFPPADQPTMVSILGLAQGAVNRANDTGCRSILEQPMARLRSDRPGTERRHRAKEPHPRFRG
jgi:8-oxo-dGTP diphosphatase